MRLLPFLTLGLFVLIYGCGNDPRNHVVPGSSVSFANDAEVAGVDFWINEDHILTSSVAHSGTRVSVTDSIMPFSIGFRKTLGTISQKQLKSVVISAWIYSDTLLKSFKGLSLVASVDNDSKNIYFKGVEIENSITEAKKWTYVSEEVPLEFDQKPDNLFVGYILNNSKAKVLIDDLSFFFIERIN